MLGTGRPGALIFICVNAAICTIFLSACGKPIDEIPDDNPGIDTSEQDIGSDSMDPDAEVSADSTQGDDHSDLPRDTDTGNDTDTHPRACNGMPGLCDRPLDQIAFVTTHNSMANQDDFFAIPNQYSSVTKQLQAGVRAFMIDTWYDNTQDPPPSEDVYLCHGVCVFGMRLLSDTLDEIKTFLEQNPDDFVVLIFESYVSAQHTRNSFDQAGVTDWLLEPEPGLSMPTIAQAVDSGKRMLVLTDSGGGGFPGYLPVWDWAFETHWSNRIPDDLSCSTNRGDDSNPFFILNHFLTDPTALPELAELINENPFFTDRAIQCWRERGHIPNFVTVDFFEIGDVIDVVSQLNLATAPVRR